MLSVCVAPWPWQALHDRIVMSEATPAALLCQGGRLMTLDYLLDWLWY